MNTDNGHITSLDHNLQRPQRRRLRSSSSSQATSLGYNVRRSNSRSATMYVDPSLTWATQQQASIWPSSRAYTCSQPEPVDSAYGLPFQDNPDHLFEVWTNDLMYQETDCQFGLPESAIELGYASETQRVGALQESIRVSENQPSAHTCRYDS